MTTHDFPLRATVSEGTKEAKNIQDDRDLPIETQSRKRKDKILCSSSSHFVKLNLQTKVALENDRSYILETPGCFLLYVGGTYTLPHLWCHILS